MILDVALIHGWLDLLIDIIPIGSFYFQAHNKVRFWHSYKCVNCFRHFFSTSSNGSMGFLNNVGGLSKTEINPEEVNREYLWTKVIIIIIWFAFFEWFVG